MVEGYKFLLGFIFWHLSLLLPSSRFSLSCWPHQALIRSVCNTVNPDHTIDLDSYSLRSPVFNFLSWEVLTRISWIFSACSTTWILFRRNQKHLFSFTATVVLTSVYLLKAILETLYYISWYGNIIKTLGLGKAASIFFSVQRLHSDLYGASQGFFIDKLSAT